MFGLNKPKSFPRLTPDMIQPPGKTPEAAEAKRLYIDFMSAIGFHAKQDLSLHARYFAEDLRSHEQTLREQVADAKQDLQDAKSSLKECKAELKAAKDDKERKWAEEALSRAEAAVNDAEVSLTTAQDDLQSFKLDKRPFLVEYVNRELLESGASEA